MATITKIQWTDHTFNPVIGCSKVHTGCLHCYAEADMGIRRKRVIWGPNGTRSMTSPQYWRQPLAWDKEAKAAGERRRVFCASLADVFEDWQGPILNARGGVLLRSTDGFVVGTEADDPAKRVTMDDIRRNLFGLIDATPNLDWLLLTKRPENIPRMWPIEPAGYSRSPIPTLPPLPVHTRKRRNNVWLGTSVSDQPTLDKMAPEILKCRDLTPVLFLSAEPLIGAMDVRPYLKHPSMPDQIVKPGSLPIEYLPVVGLDWIIAGGESGRGARPCSISAIREIVRQCRVAQAACFVKQLGSRPCGNWGGGDNRPDIAGTCEANWFNLRDPKGGDPEEWPKDLVVREFPKA